MDETSIEMYLSQLCLLATTVRSDALQKAVQLLCEKSLRIAVKVSSVPQTCRQRILLVPRFCAQLTHAWG
jgi:hypothetical protein